MILLKTLDNRDIYLNIELIEQIESIPETLITLISGKKLLIKNSPEEVVDKTVEYRRKIYSGITGVKAFEVK